jgi:hypothetical protein
MLITTANENNQTTAKTRLSVRIPLVCTKRVMEEVEIDEK